MSFICENCKKNSPSIIVYQYAYPKKVGVISRYCPDCVELCLINFIPPVKYCFVCGNKKSIDAYCLQVNFIYLGMIVNTFLCSAKCRIEQEFQLEEIMRGDNELINIINNPILEKELNEVYNKYNS